MLLFGFIWSFLLSCCNGRTVGPVYRSFDEAGPWLQQATANMKEEILRVSQNEKNVYALIPVSTIRQQSHEDETKMNFAPF